MAAGCMDTTRLADVLVAARDSFSRIGRRFVRRRRWTPSLVAMGLVVLVGRCGLTSIEGLMEIMADLAGWDSVPSDSTFVEARQALQRLRPQAILELWQDLAAQALEVIPSTRRTIGGLRWIAVDGSWVWTPRSASLVRRYGRPKAGDGKLLHYPQALMVTALDVLTRIPVAIGVRGHADGERNLLRGFLDSFQAGMVAMFDRGFPAKDLLWELTSRQAHVLWRMGTAEANSWDCVYQFLRDPAKPREALATIRVPAADGGGEIRQIQVRLIRRVFRRGRPKTGQKRETMVLMTTLLDEKAWPADRLVDMYERRWVIESWFGDLKVRFDLESFHSTTADGVEQEIFALMAWITLCGIVERDAYRRIERSRGKQDPEDPLRYQISYANLYHVCAQLMAQIVAGLPIAAILDRSERSLNWLSQTARKRRPGRTNPRVRKAPAGRWKS